MKRVLILVIAAFVGECAASLFFQNYTGDISFLLKGFRSEESKRQHAIYHYSFPNSVRKIPQHFSLQKMSPGEHFTPQGIKYSVNSLGYRGKEFSPYLKTKYRIFCLGSSTTAGLQSPEDQTYPALLEKALRGKGWDVEVINAGFSGKSLQHSKLLLFKEIIQYKPDLVIISNVINTVFLDARVGAVFDEISEFKLPLSKRARVNGWLCDNVMLYKALTIMYGKKGIQIAGRAIDETFFRRLYREQLEEIVQAGSKCGFRACFIKEPIFLNPPVQHRMMRLSLDELMNLLKDPSNEEFTNKTYKNQNDVTKLTILGCATLNLVIDQLREAHPETIVIDPLNDFLWKAGVDSSELFSDYIHLTSKGNQLMATVVAEDLQNAREFNRL